MKIKIFYPNSDGKIELSKEKLETILNEAYQEGYRDGKNANCYYYQSPYVSTLTGTSSALRSIDEPLCNKVSSVSTDIEQINATLAEYDSAVVSMNITDGVKAVKIED